MRRPAGTPRPFTFFEPVAPPRAARLLVNVLFTIASRPSVEVEIGPGVTSFVGRNGQGKTNLVEAIDYLSRLSSHRVATDAPLVRAGAQHQGARGTRGDRHALGRHVEDPGEHRRRHDPHDHGDDQRALRPVRQAERLEGDVGDLQQHPAADQVGGKGAQHAAAAQFGERMLAGMPPGGHGTSATMRAV